MFSQRRRQEIENEIAELQSELAELNDISQLFETLRAVFGEKDWENHVIDGYVTSEEGPGDYRPDIRFTMCLELHETLVEWKVDVTGGHSNFDVSLRVKFNKYDGERYEEVDEDEYAKLDKIKHPDDREIVKIIMDAGLPDDISFIWDV